MLVLWNSILKKNEYKIKWQKIADERDQALSKESAEKQSKKQLPAS